MYFYVENIRAQLSWRQWEHLGWYCPSLNSDKKATAVLSVQQQIRKMQCKHRLVC